MLPKKFKDQMIEVLDKKTGETHKGAIRILTIDNGLKITENRIFLCDEHCGRIFPFNEQEKVVKDRTKLGSEK